MVKENGQSLTEDDDEKIQPTNDFFNALFSSIIVLINGVEVGNIGTFHPQTALLHNLIDRDQNFQDSILKESNIWFKDYQYPTANPVIRHKFIKESKPVKLFGRLNHNVFTTNRLLVPNMTVQIKMRRSDDRFCLIRSDGVEDKYKIVFQSCKLNVRRVLFYDSILDQLRKHAKNHVAKFPYTQTKMDIFQIPQGSSSMQTVAIEQNSTRLPKRAYFTICEAESINGNSWANNPMIFPAGKYGVNYVQFFSNYDNNILQKAYEPDFANNNTNRSYAAFVQAATNAFRSGQLPGLTCDDFQGQYGLFAIDKLSYSGDLSVKIGFKQPTPRLLTGVLFTQRDAYFTINGASGVMNDG